MHREQVQHVFSHHTFRFQNNGECAGGETCDSNQCTCMAGKTALTKVEKVLGSVISSDVVEVRDLEVGDRVLGIDENMNVADECEVVSVASTGNKAVF